MQDPRNQRFYKLRKRNPDQLSTDEARMVAEVCGRMMDYVRDGKIRKVWQDLSSQYSAVALTNDKGTNA
jgi:hypothetical protein